MSKHAFWHALVFTLIVFSLGLLLGFFIEFKQSERVYFELVDSELNILDEQLRQRIISDSNISCELAKESLFSFADKIYTDAVDLEDSDATGKLTDLTVLHRRYDLLRTLLLLEAQNLKERCKGDFHIVSYLYYYNVDDVEISSKQNYFSRQLFDLKSIYPKEVILIPIAIDTKVASVDIFVKSLGNNTYPSIIINGDKVISNFVTLQELEDIVFNVENSDD